MQVAGRRPVTFDVMPQGATLMTAGEECTECTGIDKNPNHYLGDPVTDARILKCVLYEAFTLAITLQSLDTTKWPDEMSYDVPVGHLRPDEVLKNAALMKIRLLYDFLYNAESKDDFTIAKSFFHYGYNQPLVPPQLTGFHGDQMFTRKSINKFVAHLTKARITKPKCTPQPKFREGLRATIENAKLILTDIDAFVSRVVAHDEFIKLDCWGEAYLAGFRAAMVRLNAE